MKNVETPIRLTNPEVIMLHFLGGWGYGPRLDDPDRAFAGLQQMGLAFKNITSSRSLTTAGEYCKLHTRSTHFFTFSPEAEAIPSMLPRGGLLTDYYVSVKLPFGERHEDHFLKHFADLIVNDWQTDDAYWIEQLSVDNRNFTRGQLAFITEAGVEYKRVPNKHYHPLLA